MDMIFRRREVFDPDYVPEEIPFRDRQISQLVSCMQPMIQGSSPLNALCLGPPSTGKTSTIKFVMKQAAETDSFHISYIRCPSAAEPYRIFSKIFRDVFSHQPPPSGISRAVLAEKLWIKLEKPLLVVLDDVNFLKAETASQIIYEILKAPEEYGVKTGIIAVATDISFPLRLDPFAGAVFKYVEIYYPPYTRDELREILMKRVNEGFVEGCFSNEAFERVVDIASSAADARYGIFLLKSAGMIAESRRAARVEVEDVEKAHEGEAVPFLAKTLAALNSEERAVMKIICSAGGISTGELYSLLCSEVKMSYRKFYYILEKLERLRLVDIVFGEKGRGRTRYVHAKFSGDVFEKAMRILH
jgi:cell division control protein 6